MKNINKKLLDHVVEKSGLTRGELAEILGVSRQTLYSWILGGQVANIFILGRAERCCLSLKAAITAKSLPLGKDIAKGQRMRLIKSAMLGK